MAEPGLDSVKAERLPNGNAHYDNVYTLLWILSEIPYFTLGFGEYSTDMLTSISAYISLIKYW